MRCSGRYNLKKDKGDFKLNQPAFIKNGIEKLAISTVADRRSGEIYSYVASGTKLQTFALQKLNMLKEHYHDVAHAQEFDFRTGGQEFKDAEIDIELSEIRLHRPQSTLALP